MYVAPSRELTRVHVPMLVDVSLFLHMVGHEWGCGIWGV